MNEHMREVSAAEFDAWCRAYPRKLFGGAMGKDGRVEWFDKTANRNHPCAQVVAVREGNGLFVRSEIPPADYRVKANGFCDHEWNPSEAEPGKLECDYCQARCSPAEARDTHFFQKGEEETKRLVLEEVRRRVLRYQEDPHPLSQGFVRVMNDLLACIEDEKYRELNDEWVATQDIQPRPCPSCMRTMHERGDEHTVRLRREMSPVLSLPDYSDEDWYAEVHAALPAPTNERPTQVGFVRDYGPVRVTCKRGERSRVQHKVSGDYALVDAYGPARVVGAELAYLVANLGDHQQ